jgi:HK97 family phage major capsid protein
VSTLNELREKAVALSEEIDTLSRLEDPNDEQISRCAEAVEEAGTLAEQITTAEAEKRSADLEKVRSFAAKPGHIEVPAEPPTPIDPLTVQSRAKRDPYDLSEVRLGRMYDGRLNPTTASELRSRAHDAVEQAPEYVTDSHREAIARKIDSDTSGRLAGHVLEHGSPEYTDAFFRYLQTGENMRAALSTTGANGGYLIPFHLDPSIILTNAGSKNPLRQISRVETITTDVWHGVSSAGVSGEWLAEAAEFTDASPTFSQPTIPVEKAGAYVQASFEVTQDSNIASSIAMLFADAKDRLEATAFVTGSGSGQPTGILTELRANTASIMVSAQTNASFGSIDVYALVNALPARHQDNCEWLAHWSIYNLVRNFGSGANSSAFWVDLGPGIPSQLLGRSTYQSSVMPAAPLSTATASSDDILILGDFQNYLIVDRVGMEVVYNPLVIGSNRRPTGEVGWAAFWRVGADVTNVDGFRMLRV